MDKILLVDDEQSVLDGFQRQLRKKYDLSTAISGEAGLKKITAEGPFAVIVSDMRMPIMDGVAFLQAVRQSAPESVRMMLTGNADQQTAVDAINEGAIFRFLTKPCPPEHLVAAIEAGIQQYKLITAEKELLEKTLRGSINILMDILSLANPVAFSQSSRFRKYAVQIADKLKLRDAWRYEIAAMLSCVGFINIPTDTIEKYLSGAVLTGDEKEMLAAIPQTTGMLLANIPRLSVIASMITQRDSVYAKPLNFETDDQNEMVRIGAKLLKIIADFDILMLQEKEPGDVIRGMARHPTVYDETILNVLRTIDLPQRDNIARPVKITDLKKGMIIDEDVLNAQGILVIPKGYEVNDATKERLRNFLTKRDGTESVRIRTTVYKDA